MKMTDARSEIREDANDEVRASEKILSIIWGNLMKFWEIQVGDSLKLTFNWFSSPGYAGVFSDFIAKPEHQTKEIDENNSKWVQRLGINILPCSCRYIHICQAARILYKRNYTDTSVVPLLCHIGNEDSIPQLLAFVSEAIYRLVFPHAHSFIYYLSKSNGHDDAFPQSL